MTLDELAKHTETLKAEIWAAVDARISEFQKDTAIAVDDVSIGITTIHTIDGKSHSFVGSVSVSVMLGRHRYSV